MVTGENHFTYGKISVRYFIRILIGLVLCIVMYGTFFSFADAEWYQRLLSAVTLVLLIYMLYSGMWSVGMHDRDEVYFKRMKKNPLRGLSVSAAVSIPYAVINAILLLNCINAADIEKYDLSRLIYHLINSPFLFVTLNYDYHNIRNVIIAGILLPLTIILIGGTSYYLGLKNISLFRLSVYKDDSANKKEGS